MAGNAFFKWAVFGILSAHHRARRADRPVPAGLEVAMLAPGGASLLVVSLVAAWDTLSSRLHTRSPGRISA